jgi:hypothetical protein
VAVEGDGPVREAPGHLPEVHGAAPRRTRCPGSSRARLAAPSCRSRWRRVPMARSTVAPSASRTRCIVTWYPASRSWNSRCDASSIEAVMLRTRSRSSHHVLWTRAAPAAAGPEVLATSIAACSAAIRRSRSSASSVTRASCAGSPATRSRIAATAARARSRPSSSAPAAVGGSPSTEERASVRGPRPSRRGCRRASPPRRGSWRAARRPRGAGACRGSGPDPSG